MLASYLNLTAALLQNPAAPSSLYSTTLLTNFINIARGQIAAEGECCRAIGTIGTVIGQRNYNFSLLNFSGAFGGQVALNIRRIQYNVGAGQKLIKSKSWEWFDSFRLNNPVPQSGAPTEWAQYGQGSSGLNATLTGSGGAPLNSGSFYIDPLPDLVYTLNCDCTCYPQALATDSDAEAIPYLWTDAVPYYAAYMALMSSQTGVRIEQAQRLFQLFEQFMSRARAAANPPVNNFAFEQAADPMKGNRLGVSQQARAG